MWGEAEPAVIACTKEKVGRAITHSSIDLVKIDTGSECDVLDGGTRALFHKLRPRKILVNVDAPASYACVQAAAERHAFDVLAMTLGPSMRPPNSGKHLLLTDRHRTAGRLQTSERD